MGILFLLLILEEKFSAFHHLSMLIAWAYYILPLLVHSLYTRFIENFYHGYMLNFVRCFLCIYWFRYIICILYLVNVIYHVWGC